VLVDPGFLAIYPYGRSRDEEIPKVEEGQELALARDAWFDAKETQPPSRIGQGKLIEMMEELGLGTKATRHDIIQKLYDRGYVQNNPIEPSETGIAMVKAFRKFAERVATPSMTAELEADMDKIAQSEVTKDQVVQISRDMLRESYDLMDEHKRELAEIIWEGMNQDRILGPCPKCRDAGRKNEEGNTNRLKIIRAKKSGKRFVGCEGYPDCDQTYGIPQRGELIRLEETCSICGETPRLKVWTGRRPWNLCLNEECPSMVEMRAQRAEREAARAAKEAAAAAAAADGDGAAAADDAEKKPAKKPAKRRAPART
jgi:DNA topoisomerase-1